ncbi:DNA replication and repair protein RecF [Dysgonomonas sp. PH5-45]|uniref:DNA replication/repair protein RecF n=1 Tax=unclassified Dysgonomonas TaxID=2630389 RepID=UPI0024753C14|nr:MULTISPECIES: DNA replication and repair protein RecF [unclassified Dysgonomonas]MDH6354900.1 DNA replication and repair protein RecF [Dysgonomonas sp. PH5-45]MDH6387799.1 DNA replication and repair protein RecF [Dysgonomonas sp. PH5-37]
MILERISILNFKNIGQSELSFSPKLNCFLGNNGMGKTNLLDVIYYLSFCKSHSNAVDSQNINHDSDMALIQGWYDVEGRKEEFLCSLKRRHKKVFKRNKKEYEKLSEHIGTLPLVMTSPEDTEFITGGSDTRRKLMDQVLSQLDKEYLHALIRYNKALQQRNALLKTGNGMADDTLFDLWEEQMVNESAIVFSRRKNFIEQFTPTFQRYYDFICCRNEKVELTYRSQLHESDLASMLKDSRGRDTILGFTTAGIHRDDLEMHLGEYLIKKTGSQGQRKTYAIAFKLAQFAFLVNAGITTPILLLDDIFDKLDSLRVKQIITLVLQENFGQIFITDTNREHLSEMLREIGGDYRLFFVEQGSVTKTEGGSL